MCVGRWVSICPMQGLQDSIQGLQGLQDSIQGRCSFLAPPFLRFLVDLFFRSFSLSRSHFSDTSKYIWANSIIVFTLRLYSPDAMPPLREISDSSSFGNLLNLP